VAPDDDIPDLLPSADGAASDPRQSQGSARAAPIPGIEEESSHLSLVELETTATISTVPREGEADPPDPLEFDLVSARGSQFPDTFPLPSVPPQPKVSEAPSAGTSMELNFEASPSSRKSVLPAPGRTAQNVALILDFNGSSSTPPKRQASAPPPKAPQSLANELVVPSALGDNFDLGDDLDDLEFGGSSAQLNVAVDTSEKERDVRWPTGRTPFADEIAPDLVRAQELSGFGPAPRSLLLTPFYAVRVHRSLETVREQSRKALQELKQREARRDEALCALAEEKRASLQQNPRFAPLYSNIKGHEDELKSRAHELESSNEDGSRALSRITHKIDDLNAFQFKKQDLRDKAQVKADAAKKEVARYAAALKQIDIRYRNLQHRLEREAPGKVIPDEFEAQFQMFDDERQGIETRLQSAKTLERSLRMAHKEADRIFGKAAAAHQAEEGKKEAFLISQEGTLKSKNEAWGRVARSKTDELAEAARVILELKGEVPVDSEARQRILDLDEGVRAAFIHNQNMMMAGSSMDPDAYSTGRSILVACAVGLVLLLLWGAL
jgi:hypothetical protein